MGAPSSISPPHTSAATAADITILWSPNERAQKGLRLPPNIASSSSERSSVRIPIEERFSIIAANRSLSFARRRDTPVNTLSPSATAASTESTGARSGISVRSAFIAEKALLRARQTPSWKVTSAPQSASRSKTALSFCLLSRLSPRTLTSPPRTPAAIINAAFDQSPSTHTVCGE